MGVRVAPVNARHIPNVLTVLRMLLVPAVVYAVLGGRFGFALILLALAAASDGIDGFLARRYGWQTRLGAILDPVADKLLLVSVFVALTMVGGIPLWLVVLVVVRDLVIVAGAAAYRLLFGELELAPTMLSKLNTLLQVGLVLIVLLDLAGLVPFAWLVQSFLVAVTLSTALSGIHYVWVWSARALGQARGG